MGVGATEGVPVATLLEGLSVECYGLLCQKVVLRGLSDRLSFLVFSALYLFVFVAVGYQKIGKFVVE